eukprot:TRINITY_DN3417_c0_g1_i1.p1 TRINITY_DN3417_c0_g1~~TRINITY_DN3417_c0_g1_i1.p1  ORF type:complete len:443 (-),score=64.13 TRINITY_DN3417_c0_g1_i1:1334-2662(-)
MEPRRPPSAEAVCSNLKPLVLKLQDDVIQYLRKWYGEEELNEMLKALATPPRQTTIRVNTLRITRNELLEKLKDHHKKIGENRFVFLADERLPDLISVEPVDQRDQPQPIYPPMVVGCKAGESILRGAHLYAVGALGAPPNLVAGTKVSLVVDVASKTLRGEIIESFSRDCHFIGNGVAQFCRTVMFQAKEGVGVTVTEQLFPNPSFNDVFTQEMYLQNFPSQLVAHLLNPQEGDTIIDMCSAPGGKTTHVAALMNDKGKIFALDKNKKKVQDLEKTIKTLGFTCITAMNADAAKASAKFAAESFDRIVLDPPCSGLGNRPRFLEEMSAKTLTGYADYQRRIFGEAMKLLKPGGTLVYSTCTINPEENEETVQWALDTYSQHLELVEPPRNLKFGLAGLTTARISEENRKKVMRFSPADKSLDVMGFFIALFKKTDTLNGKP